MLLAGGNGDLGADRRAPGRGGGWLAQRARRPRLATTPVAIWHPQTGRFLCDRVSSWADVCCDRCQAIGVGRTRMVTNVICNCWHCASLVVFVRVCRRRRRAARRSGHIACSAARPLAGSSAAIAATGCYCRWGYERELRLALVDGFTCWGARCSASQDPPTSADARGGLRIGQVPDAVSVDTTAEGPGLMILDDELEILAITPHAPRRTLARRASG